MLSPICNGIFQKRHACKAVSNVSTKLTESLISLFNSLTVSVLCNFTGFPPVSVEVVHTFRKTGSLLEVAPTNMSIKACFLVTTSSQDHFISPKNTPTTGIVFFITKSCTWLYTVNRERPSHTHHMVIHCKHRQI